MVGLDEVRDLVASIFIMLNEKTFVLFRIEFLVVVVTVLFLAMFIVDVFRRYIHNAIMKSIFSLLDEVSDSIVAYLLGAMQTARFKNQLFPVWALVIISFRYSVGFISGYGVADHAGRRFTEYNNVVKLLAGVFLVLSRGTRFVYPLSTVLALQMLRSWCRFAAHRLASNSLWHGKSSELVSEYVRTFGHDTNTWEPVDRNLETMEGYRYLVYGETRQNIKLKKPRYVLHIDGTTRQRRNTQHERSSLITLDKIWGCRRHLLNHDNKQGNDLKDLSLAFALSRLLRCRLEDVALQGDIFHINRELVMRRVIEENDTKSPFGIMELQLAFLNDYFNTRYPMVFSNGFLSLSWSLLLSALTFCAVFWLAVDIRKVFKTPEGELAHVVQGFNVDIIITWVFMFFMMFKEIWEMVSYLLSDWTRLLLLCNYAQRKEECTRNICMENTISSFCKSRITAKQWHGYMDQYVFLESYDGRPTCWNLIHQVTLGMVPKKDDGLKLSSPINVPDLVRPAILKKLSAHLEKLSSLGLAHQPAYPNINHEPISSKGRRLPKVITILSDDDRKERYSWACFKLSTCSHVILVWHIATSLCEMKLAQDLDVDLSKPGRLASILSCFTGCFSSRSYLVDEKEKLFGKLRDSYIIANSLSRYCAYLLVSKPDLIPDSFLVPKMVFQETMLHAREDILKNCDSLQSRYTKMMEEAGKGTDDDKKKGEDVLKLGAMLGKQLINESEEGRWEVLAEVWADLLVHIAPTWNAEAHKKCLEAGGEFVTHIWALLWHCGVEKSKLWPVERVPGNGATTVTPQDSAAESDILQSVDSQQAGADTGSIKGRTEAHEENEIVGMGNSSRRPEGTGRSEIEEVSEDVAVEDANVQVVTTQTRNKR